MCFFIWFYFVLTFIFRENNTSPVDGKFSKCQMYDVNLTMIQSQPWDFADWNSTKYHEKHKLLGKYWQKVTQNQRKQWEKATISKRNQKNERNKVWKRKGSRKLIIKSHVRVNRLVAIDQYPIVFFQLLEIAFYAQVLLQSMHRNKQANKQNPNCS